MSTQNLDEVLKRIRDAIKRIDTKTKRAKTIKKALEKALELSNEEGRVILRAILDINLFMIDNTIESLEGGKERLTAQLNQVVGMAKLTQQIKTNAKKPKPN